MVWVYLFCTELCVSWSDEVRTQRGKTLFVSQAALSLPLIKQEEKRWAWFSFPGKKQGAQSQACIKEHSSNAGNLGKHYKCSWNLHSLAILLWYQEQAYYMRTLNELWPWHYYGSPCPAQGSSHTIQKYFGSLLTFPSAPVCHCTFPQKVKFSAA